MGQIVKVSLATRKAQPFNAGFRGGRGGGGSLEQFIKKRLFQFKFFYDFAFQAEEEEVVVAVVMAVVIVEVSYKICLLSTNHVLENCIINNDFYYNYSDQYI